MELEEMVRRARGGDLEAFEAVTRRFQQMAFGSALALVRDLQQVQYTPRCCRRSTPLC